jgi:hypothetical protein
LRDSANGNPHRKANFSYAVREVPLMSEYLQEALVPVFEDGVCVGWRGHTMTADARGDGRRVAVFNSAPRGGHRRGAGVFKFGKGRVATC